MNGVPLSVDSLIADITIDANNQVLWNAELYKKQFNQLLQQQCIDFAEWIDDYMRDPPLGYLKSNKELYKEFLNRDK